MKIVKPNWKESILNVSSTLANYVGNEIDISQLNVLKKELNKNYKNVLFICLDGLGIYNLKKLLSKSSILRKNVVKTITSVFPSTTCNATTTFMSSKYPTEHGLFGWSLYFSELKSCVDIYSGKNSYSKKEIDTCKIKEYLKFEPFFYNSNIPVYTIFPKYMKYLQTKTNALNYNNLEEAFLILDSILKKDDKKFVYCYIPEPDNTMHNFGSASYKSKEILTKINNLIEELAKSNSNTLFVITSDHGQTNIQKYIELYKDKELMNTLKTPMFLEPRATAFFIKNGKEKHFLKIMKKYQNKVKVFSVKNLVNKNFFGPKTNKIKMLGDFIAVPKSDDELILMSENHQKFKGHHTGLTKKEMLLPLIIINKKLP